MIKRVLYCSMYLVLTCCGGAYTHGSKLKLKSLLALPIVRQNRGKYKEIWRAFRDGIKREDGRLINEKLDMYINQAWGEEDDSLCHLLGIFFERLEPQKLVRFVQLNTNNALLKQNFNWDGKVIDALFEAWETFDDDERYRIMGLLVRYKAQNFALYMWCCDDFMRAYEYIGYDGIKAVYDAALKHEKHYMVETYKKCYKELHRAGRILYFLNEIIFEHRIVSDY